MTKIIRLTIRLDKAQRDWVSDIAKHRGITPSEVVRESIGHLREALKNDGSREWRRRVREEYIALAIDYQLAKDSPTVRADLLAEAEKRAEVSYAPA